MRLLLIDDDPEILLVARLALEKFGGHEVDSASSAAEAIEAVRARAPDAIVLDVLLPDARGPELLGRLRREPGLAAVPVVFLTGKADDARVAELVSAGAAGVIGKPFDPLALAAEVERLVGDPGGP
ncbi:MAG TPA: response regulator [Gemmatimonadota bacterium]|nr:response regulator [Gemmatimonadota bacterium]